MAKRALKDRPTLTVQEWLASVPADRRAAVAAVRAAINKRLPKGFEETVEWGMLAWVVPLALLPDTYNGRRLMLVGLGAHKKLMTVYLMTVYGDATLRADFQTAYKKSGKKLNMGGCCVHFKTLDDLPLDVLGDTLARVSVTDYVARYRLSRTLVKKKTARPAPAKSRRATST